MSDRVRPFKWETATKGTEEDQFQTPLNPAEDHMESAGLYLQRYVGPGEEDHTDDETVAVTRDTSDRLVLQSDNDHVIFTKSGISYPLEIGYTAGGNLEFTRGASGYLNLMPDANYPQIYLGSNSSTGAAYIDADNNMALCLNLLDAGPVYIGNGGLLPESDVCDIGTASDPFGDIHAAALYVGDEHLSSGICVYDATGGQTVGGTAVTINLDTVMKNMASTIYSLATDQVTIAVAGTYKVEAEVSLIVTTGTSRSQAECWLESDTGGGMSEITGTRAQMYVRTLNFGATGKISIVRDFAANEKIEVQAQQTQGTSTVQTDQYGSRLTITRLA